MIEKREPQPFFIVGAPRSGTTLAKALLRSVEGVYVLPEEFQLLRPFLEMVAEQRSQQQVVNLLTGSAFATHLKRRGIFPSEEAIVERLRWNDPGAAFQDFVMLVRAEEGLPTPRYFGDKTPENVFQLDLIFRTWPNARVLVVVRDPRDTVRSMNKAWGRSWLRGSVVWRDAMAAALEHAAGRPSALHLIRYEDIVANPVDSIEHVASWLGVDWEPENVKVVKTEERWGQAAGASGVVARESEWTESLDSRQVQLVESICFREMIALGYQPELATTPRSPRRIRVVLATAHDGVAILRSYARERGWREAISYKLRQWMGGSRLTH